MARNDPQMTAQDVMAFVRLMAEDGIEVVIDGGWAVDALPGGVTFSDNGDGTATLAGTPATGTVGSYPLTITASNASGLNASQNFTLTVQAAAGTVTVTSSANPSVFGQPVTFTATVTSSTGTSSAGTPTGEVLFDLEGSGGAVALTNGVATFSTAALATGTHIASVSYAGDANFTPASGTLSGGQTVNQAATTTLLTARMGGGLYQTDVLLEATVTPVAPGAGTPFGMVTFTGDLLAPTTVALDANGHASIVVSNAARGSLSFTATFSGNSNFNTSANTQAVFAPHVLILPMVYK